MIRIARSFSLALALFAVLSIPAAAQNSVAGTWIITVTSPDIGSMEMAYVFEQSGTEVTGRVDVSALPEIDDLVLAEGLYENNVLSFLLYVSTQGMAYTAEVEADVDGDEMVGEVYMAEMGMAMPFTGKRTAN